MDPDNLHRHQNYPVRSFTYQFLSILSDFGGHFEFLAAFMEIKGLSLFLVTLLDSRFLGPENMVLDTRIVLLTASLTKL